jgi:hypothetical protein
MGNYQKIGQGKRLFEEKKREPGGRLFLRLYPHKKGLTKMMKRRKECE